MIKTVSVLSLLVSLFATASARQSGKGYRSLVRRLSGRRGGCGCCCHQEEVVKDIFFDEQLTHGEATTLLESGPMLIQASCQPTGVSLVLTLEWSSDLFVFGDLSGDQSFNDSPLVNQVLHAGISLEKDMWAVAADGEGNDVGDGALWLSTGHYVGWGGDKTIGIHRTDKAELALVGDNLNCMVTGTLHCVIPEEFEEDY